MNNNTGLIGLKVRHPALFSNRFPECAKAYSRPKFLYRHLKVCGVLYQYTNPFNMFLRKYTALDGTEREKWIRSNPATDANWRQTELVDRTIKRGLSHKRRRLIRQFAVQFWLLTIHSESWKGYLPDFKLETANQLMRLVEKYLVSGKTDHYVKNNGKYLEPRRIMAFYMSLAMRVAIKVRQKRAANNSGLYNAISTFNMPD